MTIRFDEQVAIVTGAGNGLGRSHALELAKRGAKVVVNDLGGSRDGSGASLTSAQEVVEEIKSAGGEAMANGANVTELAQCDEMVKQTLAKWDRIDILINNAGILRDRSFAKLDMDDWRAVIDVHLNGTANCTKAVWNTMKDQGFGRILMTTSTSGIYGNFGQSNYGAAKMGVLGLMNTIWIEGEKSGIHVNAIAPTAATRMTSDILGEEMLAALKPEFVTPAALFLVSRDAPNRTVMFAGAGSFATLELRESQGLWLDAHECTPDMIAEKFEQISDMTNPDHHVQGNQHVMKILQRAAEHKKSSQ